MSTAARITAMLALLNGISTLAMLVFLYLFVLRNAPGLSAIYPISALAALYGLLYLVAAVKLFKALRGTDAANSPVPARVALALCSLLLIYVFMDSAVTDYYQPLSLYDDAIAALALWWGLLLLQAATVFLLRGPALRPMVVTLLLALAGWPAAAALWWVNTPQVGDRVAANSHVWVGGEDGYDIYRIPGLVLIPRGSQLHSGQVLAADRILAFAEARRDGSLDTGVIDLVLKISDDQGKSWSNQAVICRHQVAERRGKCGNPTPLFDSATGRVFLAYNLSGLETGNRHHSGHIMVSDDGGHHWGEPRQLSEDNFVFGPGKGLRKNSAPHNGRLLLPGYVDGISHLVYSDDNGANWQRAGGLAEGDESDVAELSTGQLYLASRHRAPIAHAPEPNGRQFSISNDGGASWPAAQVDTRLPTPVCQASILSSADGGLLFSNPAHSRSRVKMTVRYSDDNGASWPSAALVYPGPAGYSVLAQGTDGDVYLLYENGNMAYSERISLARMGLGELLPQ